MDGDSSKSYYDLIYGSIDTEYQLNDGRVNSLLVFNAILIGFYGVLFDFSTEESDLIESSIWIIPFLGLISAFVSGIAIYAGIWRIFEIKKYRQFTYPDDSSVVRKLGSDTNTLPHWLGVFPYFVYPFVLFVFWCCLIIT